MLEQWRKSWAEWCNHKLYFVSDERIDHRSYEAQGIEKIPTIHLGAGACAIEKKGKKTDRGLLNMQIEIENTKTQISNIRKELSFTESKLDEEMNEFLETDIGCPRSEMAMYCDDGDYVAILSDVLRQKTVPNVLLGIEKNLMKIIYDRKNYEKVMSVIDELNDEMQYVIDHGYSPHSWNDILDIYQNLRQQEEQQKQQSAPKPETPKSDTPDQTTIKPKQKRI